MKQIKVAVLRNCEINYDGGFENIMGVKFWVIYWLK